MTDEETTPLKRKRPLKSKATKKAKKNDHESNVILPVKESPKKVALEADVRKNATFEDKYPVLNNVELIKKFQNVPLTNNQKGRIRQVLKDSLIGTSKTLVPDIINGRIQSILNSSVNLTDTELRKIRILYNMLKTASMEALTDNTSPEKKQKKETKATKSLEKKQTKTIKKKKDKENDIEEKGKGEGKKNEDTKKKVQTTPKGVKRYVVFVGNLPLEVTKDMILSHFSELADNIKDVRLPKQGDGKKSAIAYVELKNEPSYELALSKHHTMMSNKRINVLYSTQKNSKMTKTEAKSKSAKMQALQKSGQLIGSLPLNQKRSQRRKKQRAARARENKDV